MRQEQLQNKFNRLKVLYKSKCEALKVTQRELRKTNGVVPSKDKSKKEKRLRRRSRSAPFKISSTTAAAATTTPSSAKNKSTENVKVEDDISRFRSPSFGTNRRRRMSEDSESGDIQLPSNDQIDSILLEDLISDSSTTTSSLIDHFIVVGLPSSRDWSPQSHVDSTKPSLLASLNGRWKPHILYQHPRGLDASQKYSRLAEFCLPNGAEVRIKSKSSPSSSKPRLHTFMLSGGEEAVYGICLIVSQPLESVDEFVKHGNTPILVKSIKSAVKSSKTVHHPVSDVATVSEIVLPPPSERSPSLTLSNESTVRTGNLKRNMLPKSSSWVSSLFAKSPLKPSRVSELEEKKDQKQQEEEEEEDEEEEEEYFAETDRCYCILARYPLYSVYASILSVLLNLASLDRDDRKDCVIVKCSRCKIRNVCSNRESVFVCHRCGTAVQNPQVFASSTPVCETFCFEEQGSLGLVLAQCDTSVSNDQQYSAVVSQFARSSDGSMLHAETWGKIRKGAFVTRVNSKCTKKMSYDDVIGLFQTSERPLTIEFMFMEPKRPPPLQISQNNGTGSPPISPDFVERKPEFSPRGTFSDVNLCLMFECRKHTVSLSLIFKAYKHKSQVLDFEVYDVDYEKPRDVTAYP